MNEELINEIITYNYNNFGNEFGDALVDLRQENKKLHKNIDKAIEYIKGFDIKRLHEVMEHNLVDVLEALLEILKGSDIDE